MVEPQKEVKNQNLQDDADMIIESSEELEVVKSFDELSLREELLRGNNTSLIFNSFYQ
jgi:hypothetical protein